MSAPARTSEAHRQYVRDPQPLHFPSEAEVPESSRHLELRTFLHRILKHELAGRATVGSDQFVYWDASNPKRCLAPDVFVRFGVPVAEFENWKTWEHGAPELAVEITSKSDADGITWTEKLSRYHALGVRELVRFSPDEPPGRRLTVWNRVEDDLVERVLGDDRSPCPTLEFYWVVAPGEALPWSLRLARDEAGTDLLPSDADRLETSERKLAAEHAARIAAETARDAAERRVAELEAVLERSRSEPDRE